MDDSQRFRVAALYVFTRITSPETLVETLSAELRSLCVRGILLVAPEGINGTLAGTPDAIRGALQRLRAIPGCERIEPKFSSAIEMPFRKLRVRLKSEIVTLGAGPVDPTAAVGRYVKPEDWNDLISDPEVVVIDTRNDYEVAIGSFEGAVDPKTESFRDFPAWWRENAARFHNKKVAMFCTGGIRCEKSTSWLLGEGVKDVFHLEGGILKYLEEVPEEESLWRGECFVFDERVSVGHGLEEGPHVLCGGCRRPLAPADLKHPAYERGVSCHHCIDERTAEDRARFRERQRQIDLAAARGERHLGETG
ncbi:rhodanese-related sulfurtransferase [Pontivivens ytuae]|uniref:tRNA uridine(34) hydroxylase n=1 Tax=Pontivivens ytuae TaxID=2789856 RepID=A0A7S9LQ42_9RHOB|nr:rhodanese-related sulfurtransferase [Pontivivens ytuae]QPH52900.1 rhodanese-related sulfurtransferase [Pontivivens ytuae]